METQDIDSKYQVLEPLHKALLMMLGDFSAICEQEGLRWYASFGTAIGALRDGGFIPWDEDLDICMPREDLNRLIAVVQRDHAKKYEMINAEINPKYPMLTTRMMLRGTKCCDSALASMDFDSAIFLDLFPLDALSDGETAFKKQVYGGWLLNKLAIVKLVDDPFIKGDGVKSKVLHAGTACMRGLLKLPGLRSADFNKKALRVCTGCADARTRRWGFIGDTVPTWDVYDRADFEPARWVPFEDTKIRIANKAEKHLAALYGDWQTPISVDQRDDHFPDVLELGPYAKRFGAEK